MEKTVIIEDKVFALAIPAYEINHKISEIAHQITLDYVGKDIALLVILDGAFSFAAALSRMLDNPSISITFAKYSSYEGGLESGKLKMSKAIEYDVLKDKHVIIIDDICDSGKTLSRIKRYVSNKDITKSIKTATLCKRALSPYEPDYFAFETEDFLVGYGMDYRYKGRTLNSIYTLIE